MRTFHDSTPVNSAARQYSYAGRPPSQRRILALAVLLTLLPGVSPANPVGEQVAAGAATFQRAGNALTIRQSSDRAVINWQGFSIGASELTKFIQPSASSAVLNRVVSGSPSSLLGQLESNGKVFLINPNGILVGGGAVINTNGFVASTRDIRDSQFMSGGDLNFSGTSTAGIQNLGTIRAQGGDVFLIAHTVDNSGVIEAAKGIVGLAAGTDVLLRQSGDERLFVQTTVSDTPGTASGVKNSGIISAVQAELRAAGGNVYALAVNNSGAIHATGIAELDGRILLTSSGGNIENSGALTARNANGDGGKVIIIGERTTLTGSTLIDVSADVRGGNGGFVETSGKELQVASGARIDASAANGLPGQWLLDPFNVRVVDFFTGTSNGGFSGGNPNVFTPTGNDSTVDASTISNALTNGTDVTITTAGAGTQNGNIQVDANIIANVPKTNATVPTLTLNADNRIVLNSAVQGSIGSKGINLTAFAKGLTPDGLPAINVTTQGNLFLIRKGSFTANTRGINVDGSINSLSSDNVAGDKWSFAAAGDITGLASGNMQAFIVDLKSTAGAINYAGGLGADTLTAAATGLITINNVTGVNVTNLGTTTSGGAINIRNTGNGGSALNVVGSVTAGGASLAISNVGTLFIDSTGSLGKGTGTVTDNTGTVTLTGRSITDGLNPVAPSISAAALALSATQGGTGIGTAANPIDTSVSNLEALTQTGGIFIKNTGKQLTIGGIPSFAVGGVLTPNNANGGQIQIVNDRTVSVTDATAEQAHVAGPQDILIRANGATSDIQIADNSPNAVNAHNGNVTLNAARDVVVGAFGRKGDVTGATVNLNGGHAVVIDEGSTVTGGAGGVNVTAGTIMPLPDSRAASIVFFQTAVSGARFVTTGAPINLTTAPGGFIDAHSGSAVAAISSGGGVINFRTDDVMLTAPVNAGTGFVQFLPVSPGRAFDVGTNTSAKYSLTNAELGLVTAGTVVIGDAANRNDVSVTAPITVTTFGALGLQALGTGGGGNMIGAPVTLANGFVEIQATNSITGSGAINGSRLTLTSDNGNIVLSGPVTTGGLVIPGAGLVSLESLSNQISVLGDILRRGPVTIRNTIPLTIHGVIAGPNTNNDVTIRTVGDITMNGPGATGFSGARVVSSGQGNQIVLEAGNGHFINNAGPFNGGPRALDPQNGARFRVYSADNTSPYNPGGLSGDERAGVSFPSDPDSAQSVFYFAAQSQPANGGGSSGGTGGSTGNAGNDAIVAPPAVVRNLLSLPEFQPQQIRAYGGSPRATLTVTPDSLSADERLVETNGERLIASGNAGDLHELIRKSSGFSNADADDTMMRLLQDYEKTNRPWQVVVPFNDPTLMADVPGLPGFKVPAAALFWQGLGEGVRIASASTIFEEGRLAVIPFDGGDRIAVPSGGWVDTRLDENENIRFGIYDRDGRLLATTFGNIAATGSGNYINDQLTTVVAGRQQDAVKIAAARRQAVLKAEAVAGPSVVLSNGQRVFIPKGDFLPPPPLGQSVLVQISLLGGLGQRVTDAQITSIVASGGGNLTRNDVSAIVATGGGNFTPGVIAAIVASGGGNLTSQAISGIVATGGGNISSPIAMMSIISASIVATGGGNIVASGGGNIVATGGGNLNSQIANIVASGGGNIGPDAVAKIVASGGGNLISQDGAGIISQDGAGLMAIAAGIVATGGGNISADRASQIVASGGGNIVASGGGNFYNTINALVAAGGSNLIGNTTAGLIGNTTAGLIGGNSAGLIPSLSAGSLISPNGAGLISPNGAGFSK